MTEADELDHVAEQGHAQRRIALITIAVLVAAAAIIVGVVAAHSSSAPQAASISGTLTLSDPGNLAVDQTGACLGQDGFADIKAGAQVVVTDQSGKTIAVGELDGDGTPGDATTAPGTCVFTFHVPDVPAAKFYGVEVAHRGVVQVGSDQLNGVALTLG